MLSETIRIILEILFFIIAFYLLFKSIFEIFPNLKSK
jgi:hypothetical protein